MSIFSDRIRDERIKHGKKQSEVAEYLGTSIQNYSAYENKREPSFDVLCKLADYYEVSTDYLLGRSDTPIHVLDALKNIIRLYDSKLTEFDKIDYDEKIASRAGSLLESSLALLIELLASEDLSSPGIYENDYNADDYWLLFQELISKICDIIRDFDIYSNEYDEHQDKDIPGTADKIMQKYNTSFKEKLCEIIALITTYHEYKSEHLRINFGLRNIQRNDVSQDPLPQYDTDMDEET